MLKHVETANDIDGAGLRDDSTCRSWDDFLHLSTLSRCWFKEICNT